MIEIKFTECENLKNPDEYGFGDYMLKLTHRKNGGWLYADLCPRSEVGVFPSAAAMGVTAEETVRVGARGDGKLAVFRLRDYIGRLDRQAREMGLPSVDTELTEYGVKQLLSLSRPFMKDSVCFLQLTLISLETDADIYPAREALLTVTVKKEKPADVAAITACASTECIMARPHKFGAPFAFSVREGVREAKKRGFDNVLWLDSTYGRYVDALAGMDIFFHVGDKILCAGDGFTSDSVITLMKEWGIEVSEERISTDGLIKAFDDGQLTEAFAVSTRKVVVPVELIDIDGKTLSLPRTKLAKKLYDTFMGIYTGDYPDKNGWVTVI